jgi:hypothetical protein
MWQKMLNTVRKGRITDSLSNSTDQYAEAITDKAALLHDQVQSKKRSAIQDGNKANGTQAKVEQLSRQKDHYTAIMTDIEKEEAIIKEEVAKCCTAVKQQERLMSSSRKAGQAFLRDAVRNRMSPSGVAEFDEDEVEKLKEMADFLDRASACKTDCKECRKYKIDRCW